MDFDERLYECSVILTYLPDDRLDAARRALAEIERRKDDPGYDTHREITRWMRAAERAVRRARGEG